MDNLEFETLTSAEFKEYTRTHKEKNYLVIEYSAFELYRTMAERCGNSEAQSIFLSIAQTEKAHMRTLTRAFDQCPENNHQ